MGQSIGPVHLKHQGFFGLIPTLCGHGEDLSGMLKIRFLSRRLLLLLYATVRLVEDVMRHLSRDSSHWSDFLSRHTNKCEFQ